MGQHFVPLETEVRHKNLTYVSAAKLEQLVLDPFVRGLNFTLPLNLGGVGAESDELGVRDLLGAAARLFEQNQLLTYEVAPKVGEWLLVRAIATCGSAWPWAGDHEDLIETAWWVGSSANLRILAYGHRSHLLGTGKIPSSPEREHVATWWPSIDGGYRDLLSAVAGVVVSDDVEVSLAPQLETGATFSGVENYFFNPGVNRNEYLVKRGVFEMMLRVDGIEDDGNGTPIVYGSPLWVAKESRVVPGTYTIADFPDLPGVTAVASWDGGAWSDRRLQDHRNPSDMRRNPTVELPEMPTVPPELETIVSLAIREQPLVAHLEEFPAGPAASATIVRRRFWDWLRNRKSRSSR